MNKREVNYKLEKGLEYCRNNKYCFDYDRNDECVLLKNCEYGIEFHICKIIGLMDDRWKNLRNGLYNESK